MIKHTCIGGRPRKTRSGKKDERVHFNVCLQDTFPQKVSFSLLLSRKSSASFMAPPWEPSPQQGLKTGTDNRDRQGFRFNHWLRDGG